MAASGQTMKVTLQRDSLQTPWGFRLQGGADFRTPFAVNKISAGTPADGQLRTGDLILEINDQPIGSLLHADALALIQRAGGQINFLIQRGVNPMSSPHSSTVQQRPISAVPWSYANHPSLPWSQAAGHSLTPMSCFRNRPLERIPEPKPLLSQTGSPILPGPVPSVSTKTRGYMAPPSFHSERLDSPTMSPYSSGRFYYPGPSYHSRNRTMSSSSYNTSPMNSPSWRNSVTNESESFIPSYQKKLQTLAPISKPSYSGVNPNLVHRQFNSPMSLYSNDNVQEVMNHHINRMNTTPPTIPEVEPSQQQTYHITLLPTLSPRSTMSLPVQYVSSNSNSNYASDF